MRKFAALLLVMSLIVLVGSGCGDEGSTSKPKNKGDRDVIELADNENSPDGDEEIIQESDPEEQCNGCLIDGKCWQKDDTNPENVCEKCDPNIDPYDWTSNEGASCDDGNPLTIDDTCTASGECKGTLVRCTQDSDCDDGVECTEDKCVDHHCQNELLTGWCLINGRCIEDGTAANHAQCRVCNAAANPNDWSFAPEGTTCDDGDRLTINDACTATGDCVGTPVECVEDSDCDDSYTCTTDTCVNNQCQHTIDEGWCLIDNLCVSDGEASVTQQCRVCNAASTQEAWSFAPEGTECDDGDDATVLDICDANGECHGITPECRQDSDCDDGVECTQDTCENYACVHSISEGWCRIEGECVESGTTNPTNQCQECNPSVSQEAWSNKANGSTCDDGLFCTDPDQCINGECVGTQKDWDDGLWCNGEESCDEENDQILHSGNPCNELTENCDEEADMCVSKCEGVQINNGARDTDDDGDGWSELYGDCNDASAEAYPGNTEVYDGIDNDCDGRIDEGFDDDCDGFVDVAEGGNDCNDEDPEVRPGAEDNDRDRVDENCDGVYGDATTGDADHDGYAANVDCDDNDPNLYPGSVPGENETSCAIDRDGDGFGDSNPPEGFDAGSDCDDGDWWTKPDAVEIPDDGEDQDCSGSDLGHSEAFGIFVSSTLGDDTNPGTMDAPVKTIGKGMELAENSNKPFLFVAGGVYQECVVAKAGIIGGYNPETWEQVNAPTLIQHNCSSNVSVLFISRANDPVSHTLIFANLTIQGPQTYPTNAHYSVVGINELDSAYKVLIVNSSITQTTPRPEESGTGHVYLCNMTSCNMATIIIRNSEFVGPSENSHGTTIAIHADQYSWENIYIDGTTIDAGYSVDQECRGISIDGAGGYVQITNNIINPCTAPNSAATGIYIRYSENNRTVKIARNHITGGKDGSRFAIALSLYGRSITVDRNFLIGGDGQEAFGINLFGGSMYFTNNYIYAGTGSGYRTIGIHFNYNSRGQYYFINNTILAGYSEVSYSDGLRADGSWDQASDIYLINNIIIGGSGAGDGSCIVLNERDWFDNFRLIANDLYVVNDNGCLLWDRSETNSCIANLSEVNGCTWHGCTESRINMDSDPRLESGYTDGLDNFNLPVSSPCIDAGIDPSDYINLPSIYYDFEGDERPQNDYWDIGMDERIEE